MSKIQGLSRTSQAYPTVIKDKNFRKNPDLSVKILLLKCSNPLLNIMV